MSDTLSHRESTRKIYPAEVVAVLSASKIVINRGTEHNVEAEDQFVLYEMSDEEILEPSTGESLGKLEIPKGTGEVIHVQEKMAVIESDREKPPARKIVRRNNTLFAAASGQAAEEEEYVPSDKRVPFTNPKVGDLVKPV